MGVKTKNRISFVLGISLIFLGGLFLTSSILWLRVGDDGESWTEFSYMQINDKEVQSILKRETNSSHSFGHFPIYNDFHYYDPEEEYSLKMKIKYKRDRKMFPFYETQIVDTIDAKLVIVR